MTTTAVKSYDLQFDICSDDYQDEWEATYELVKAAKVLPMLVSITKRDEDAANGWPVMTVVVNTEYAARSVLAEYLQVEPWHEDVNEYLSYC